jgi:hypothetical protein
MDSDIRKAVTDAKVKGGDCSPSPVVIEPGISSNSAGMSTLSVELCFLKQNKLYIGRFRVQIWAVLGEVFLRVL